MKNIKNFKKFLKMNESENFKIKIYNSMTDYTLLDNNASNEEIISLCESARILEVKSVCVMPKHVKLAAEELKDTEILVCTVISFPEGTDTLEQKENETNQVISDGADEVDMVMDYQNFDEDELVIEISSLVDICHSSINKDSEPIILKVIVESGRLTEEQTRKSTIICDKAGADFIKTSTGKVEVGAELNKVKIMFDTIKEIGSNMNIKASGGIRTLNDIKIFEPYVDRFGIGYGSVNKMNGLETAGDSTY